MATKPVILLEGTYSQQELNDFKTNHRVWKIVDIYERQLAELFEITFPYKKFTSEFAKEQADFVTEKVQNNPQIKGNWIYFPWNGNLIHTVPEQDYFLLRTNRNKNIITADEQEKLYDSCVGFLGLSIGAHMATAITYAGIAKTIKMAEFDTLETSNLNRINAGIQYVGSEKIDLALERIYEINPYADPVIFSEGLSDTSLETFLHQDPKPSLIFEAIDDFAMKIKLRIAARDAGIPVIMLTNLGDSLLVDIERYDVDKNLPLFNGLIGNTPEEIISKPVTEEDKVKYAMQIVGKEHLSNRILQTLSEINKTLVGRPQIYSTVTIGGGFASYLARNIILGHQVKSGRTFISFDKLMEIEKQQ